jgi:uncharacterized protein YndB with AHSA1/START domain
MNRDDFAPSPLADVEATPEGESWTLVFVRDLHHPREKVWAALTEPAQLSEWAPFLADRDLSTVGDAVLTMVDGDTTVELKASVLRAEAPTLLEYSWGTDLLRWELSATDDGTRLTLRHTVADLDMAAMAAAGWHVCLDVAEHLLDGAPIGPIRGAEARDFGWDQLNEAYAKKVGSLTAGQ